MARQVIDVGTAPNQAGVDSIRTGGIKINDMTAEIYAAFGSNIRYVSKNGSDDNDGISMSATKLTIAGAMASLPTNTENGVAVPVGAIHVGNGTFSESGPLQFGSSFQLIGSGVGPSARTLITAGNTAHMFQSVYALAGASQFASGGHGVRFVNLNIVGDRVANPTATQDLLQISGGFCCVIRDCGFNQSPRWGLNLIRGNQNVGIDNCSFSLCGTESQGGALFAELTNGPINFFNSQVDSCGVIPFVVDVYGGMAVSIRDVKTEVNNGTNALHTKVLKVEQKNSDGHPCVFLLENMFCGAYGTGWTADSLESVIYETGSVGQPARYVLHNVRGDQQYIKAFKSTRTGQESIEKIVRSGTFGAMPTGGTSYLKQAAFEANGAGQYIGAGVPSHAAPNGSTFQRTDGSGTNDNFYVRRGAAWVGIA